MELISLDGLRADGRRPFELRRMKHEIGTFSNVDGSAILEMGLSKVLSTVQGPLPDLDRSRQVSSLPDVVCSCVTTPFCGGMRRVRGRSDRRNNDLQNVIQGIVLQCVVPDVLSQCQIRIGVTLIEADGGLEACAVNATMLALADAGVPMRDLAVACSAGILAGEPSLDLNYLEETSGSVSVLIAWQPNVDLLASVQLYQRMDPSAFEDIMKVAQQGCAKIYTELQEALTMRVKQLAIGAGLLEH